METGSAGDGCALRAERAAWPSRGVVMNSGVERRAERLGDARALVLLDDEGRRQDEDVAEARRQANKLAFSILWSRIASTGLGIQGRVSAKCAICRRILSQPRFLIFRIFSKNG